MDTSSNWLQYVDLFVRRVALEVEEGKSQIFADATIGKLAKLPLAERKELLSLLREMGVSTPAGWEATLLSVIVTESMAAEELTAEMAGTLAERLLPSTEGDSHLFNVTDPHLRDLSAGILD
eukprot:1026139-Amphidinium_carterae.1